MGKLATTLLYVVAVGHFANILYTLSHIGVYMPIPGPSEGALTSMLCFAGAFVQVLALYLTARGSSRRKRWSVAFTATALTLVITCCTPTGGITISLAYLILVAIYGVASVWTLIWLDDSRATR